MFKPTTININILSLIISIVIFLFINTFVLEYKKMNFQVTFNSPENKNVIIATDNLEPQSNTEQHVETKEQAQENKQTQAISSNWIIKIPEINLVAEISQGTSIDVMNKYVGHFEETSFEYGNIGLAAHNRGYPVNYFKDLKKLKEGSEIIYKHDDFEITYEVKTMEIIDNTNWEYLKNTEDNRITLITCVENEPKYRRCIQAIEKIESEEF